MLFTTILTTLAALAPLTSAQLDVFGFSVNNCPNGKHNHHEIITDCNGKVGECFRMPPSQSVKLYGGDSVECHMYFEDSCHDDGYYQRVRIPKGSSSVCANTQASVFWSYRCWTNRPCCNRAAALNATEEDDGGAKPVEGVPRLPSPDGKELEALC